MAEYYPLISRAVGGLADSTGEKRHALYERARAALTEQLRRSDPPLSDEELKREQDALEEAIRRVERESAAAEDKALVGEEPTPSLRDRALREFRESVAEAEGLGGAAADASASVRATYEHVRPAPTPPQPSSPSSPLFE